MNRSTLIALVVALMLGSGVGGYLIGRPADTVDAPPARTAAVTPAPNSPAATPAPATPAVTTPAPTPVAAPVAPTVPATPATAAPVALPQPAAAPDEAFAYRRFALDSSRAEGEACLAFNKPLATTNVTYADYLRIEPEVKSALRVVDDRLCIGGLAYGENYKVTLRTGLPGRDGVKLGEEKVVEVSLGARPAVVTLPGKGFILPRGSAVGLPVTTINVSQVGIAVYRVNERAIDRFARDRYDATYPGSQPVTEPYSLYSWLNGRNGALQWRGTMDVRNVANQPVTTAFPIRETVKDWKPGAYFVVVWNAAQPPPRGDEEEEQGVRGAGAGMWVIDTDIALTSFSGDDGLNVFARSLQTALPLAGLEVVLLSRGNEPMAKAVTAADGRVTFAAGLPRGLGAARAGAVMASDSTQQEFSRLELDKTPFDFSDRGVTGRDQPGPVDAFLYTERGVYRPGETVQLMTMMRDSAAVALANVPVTLIVKRPDGTEFTRFTQALPAGGALHQPIVLPKSSRRGRWSVAAHVDPKAPAVGSVDFSVEDFVPEKLKVELSSSQTILRPSQRNIFDVRADFLYGAPGNGLTVEADVRVTVDASPFPEFARYSFGSDTDRKAFEPPMITLKAPDTDATGKTRIEWSGGVSDTPLPLRAQVQVRVFEPGGGRATKTEKTMPVRARNAYLGIRPTWEGRYSQEGTETEFDIVALDAAGKQIARPAIQYRVERTDWNYQWYEVDGRWRWQATANDRLITADSVALKADAPTHLSFKLTWGSHRLTVVDTENNTSSTVQFYVGWYGGSDSTEETPDSLRVASDKQNYVPGETARIRIEAPFAGEALLAIATDRIVSTRSVKVPAGGTTVDVPVSAEWGAGAYALVTAWRPLDKPADRTPTRAIGLTWLGLEPKLRTLDIQIATPEKITPRQRIEVPIKVGNLQGEEAFVTLAAVDEGILQLTRFRTPDPAVYFFGKRRLGLSMRDDYGRLLETAADDLGRIRVGGDAGEIGGLDIVPTRTVALFSGPVKLDDKGEAKIALEIPDFIGQLRLMTVAYAKSRVGAAEQRLYVRDAVSADVVLPRFLAPNDRGRLALSLHNIDGQAGDYRLTVQATGAVSLDKAIAETRSLAAGQRELLAWPLVAANEAGFGKVTVEVSGPGNFAVHREWGIQVRAAQTPSAVDTVAQLAPGRELTLDRNVTAGFAAGTSQVAVSLTRVPGIDVAALLRALDKYPYGCIEQTTSRALPLLYYNDVALLGYGPTDPRIGDRVQEAVYRIVDMQLPDGSFGMWGPFAPAAEWLQGYALDFLLRARDQQMAVPSASLQRGLTWLNRNLDKFTPNAQAYGWYVLAKAGIADPGRIRYFQDTVGAKLSDGLAWAQLAAALNHVAEPGRARLAFTKAREMANTVDRNDYYGSALRNRAALLALAAEAGGREGFTQVASLVGERLTANVDQTTTQEQAWLVMAAHALAAGGQLTYSVDGEQKTATREPVVINPDQAAIARGVRLKNEGDSNVWMQVTARGVPNEPLPAATEGLSVSRQYLTLEGRPANLRAVRQNDRLIVSLTGRNIEGGYHEVALLDLLPAGFEIETVLTEEKAKSFSFLQKLTETRIAEGRDDRFFTSFNLGRKTYRSWWDDDEEAKRVANAFHVAYIVRAVTPGSFALPAVNISDMYAPRVYGRTAMGRVDITPR
ncbi:alpha-2-macroglobulin family protein [soil metagenome]